MALGILGVCEAGPRLVLSAIGGAIVDRYNRMRLLILIQYLTALPIFVLIALYATGSLVFWHMVVFNLLTSVIRSVNPSASQSLIRELVPTSVLLSAVALFSMEFNLARVIGPSIGGVLLVWISPNNCFLIYAVTLLISGLVMMRIKLPEEPAERKPENLLTELKEGFSYIQKAPVILASIAAAYIISIFVGTYNRFLPVFAKEILSVGPQGLGILMAAPGAGAITSLFFLGNSGENWRKEAMLWLSSVATPIFLILFCLSRSFWLSTVLLALVGAGQIAFRTVSRLIIQLEVPHALLGRVISVFLMDQGMRSVGSLVMGAFATFFGADVGLVLTSVVSLSLTSAVFYSLLRTKPNTLASS